MKHLIPLTLYLFLAVASCTRINPDKPTYSGDPVTLPPALSSINVPLEIPISFLENQLNKGLKELLFSEKKLPVGDGLFTDIAVHRTGGISLSPNGKNSLRIKFPMRLEGNLMFEKKLFGQIISTAIPYNESLQPEISFSPEIGKDWEVNLNNIKIESWGKPFKYTILGYEVDFDHLIRKPIENILNQQLSKNGTSGISFKSLISKTWEAFGKPYKIDQGDVDVYVYTIPQKIKINEQISSGQHLKLNVGIEGEVMTQLGNMPNKSPGPLPSLTYNEDTVNRLDLTFPLAVTYKSLDQFLNQEMVGKPIKLKNNNQLIPEQISTQSFGDRALVRMKFTMIRDTKKELQGELYLVGKPNYDKEKMAVVFDEIDFDLNTKNILARSSSWFRQDQVLAQIKKYAVYPIGQYISEARSALQQSASISTDFADFRVVNPQLDVKDIYVTKEDIRIYLDATGEVDVTLNTLLKYPMSQLFESFEGWKNHCITNQLALYEPVLEYEISQKGASETAIWSGLEKAYQVMKEAVEVGLREDMTSRSGMINNGAKKVYQYPRSVLSPEFQRLIARALAAKEVNSCMGRVVAAPTAGASGILPGTLYTLQEIHELKDRKILEGLLVGAGIALIIERNASISGAVGGCQAETGTAAAMAAGAMVYCLDGNIDQVFNAVGITIQCMLGLICDPVAGLVEIPCVVRNASAAAIANSSAQIALADVNAVIPVDECVQALGEVGASMESRYKETALGGLAATLTGQQIANRVLIQDIEILPDEDSPE